MRLNTKDEKNVRINLDLLQQKKKKKVGSGN